MLSGIWPEKPQPTRILPSRQVQAGVRINDYITFSVNGFDNSLNSYFLLLLLLYRDAIKL